MEDRNLTAKTVGDGARFSDQAKLGVKRTDKLPKRTGLSAQTPSGHPLVTGRFDQTLKHEQQAVTNAGAEGEGTGAETWRAAAAARPAARGSLRWFLGGVCVVL